MLQSMADEANPLRVVDEGVGLRALTLSPRSSALSDCALGVLAHFVDSLFELIF